MTGRREQGLHAHGYLQAFPPAGLLEAKAHQNHAGEDNEEAEQFEQGKALDPLYLGGEGECNLAIGLHHFCKRKCI